MLTNEQRQKRRKDLMQSQVKESGGFVPMHNTVKRLERLNKQYRLELDPTLEMYLFSGEL